MFWTFKRSFNGVRGKVNDPWVSEEQVIMNWIDKSASKKVKVVCNSRIRQDESLNRQWMSTWQQQRKGSTLLSSKYLPEESYVATVFTLVTRRNTILRADNMFRAEEGHMSTFWQKNAVTLAYLHLSLSVNFGLLVLVLVLVLVLLATLSLEYAPKHRPQMQTWMSTWWKGATLAFLQWGFQLPLAYK